MEIIKAKEILIKYKQIGDLSDVVDYDDAIIAMLEFAKQYHQEKLILHSFSKLFSEDEMQKEHLKLKKMEIIKGNWYECINEKGWEKQFILGKKYFSNKNGNLIAENKINRTIASYEYGFKLATNTPAHYDNSNGSLYKFCEEQKLNSYEFDLIKRIMRCRKKGQFEADLQSTKVLIDLYLKEYEVQEKSN